MTTRRVLLVLVVAAAFVYLRGPSARRVVSNTVIAAEAGAIQYKAVRYEADWGPQVTHSGDVRLIDRAKYKPAPFFTHHVVLTTGEYSDPGVVKLGDSGGGNFYWTAKKQPEGTILALHLVPRDQTVLRALKRIDEGDSIAFAGREELDGHVKGSNGSYLRLQHDNHKYLLLEEVREIGN
ncbi:MAG: hypothetical protein GY769_22235 [bacterium]|nr:hypothetical protein [bacterium]